MARRRQRRIHTFLQGSLCRQHYLVFPKTPALCKGKPVKVALGGSFSYIICNFGNLIYKQIFKYSQLTCIAIWKPHLEEDRCTRCRLGVSRKETAYKSSFQLRLFTQSEFRRNQVWDGDGLPWLLILMMVLAVCLWVTLLGSTAKPYFQFTAECLSQSKSSVCSYESRFGTIHNSPELLHIIKKKTH